MAWPPASSRSAGLGSSFGRLVSSPRFQAVFVALLATGLMFSKLAGNGLASYDDCYYAQKAKEILLTGDWWTLHHNHWPRFDNPPFYMWLVALAYKAFGIGEYAAKFPSALFGVATVVLVYFFARRLFTPWAGFFSALILATTVPFTRYARHAMVDATLTFFVTLALFALLLALQKHPGYFLLWGLSISLGILTKSMLGFLPLFISVLYLAASRRWRTFSNGYFWLGLATILVVGCSWYAHQYWTWGEKFLDVHFRWLIWERALGAEPQPWWAPLTYFRALALYYWPWLPLLVLGAARLAPSAPPQEKRLLLLWPATYLVGLSLPSARVLWYILPFFPAAAMISGYASDRLLPEPAKIRLAKICLALGLVAILVVNAGPWELSSPRETDVRALAPYVRHYAGQGARIIGFRQVYNRLNNALLFYSDSAAYPIFRNFKPLRKAMEEPGLTLCVLSVSELEGVQRKVPGVHVIRRTKELVLVANQPVDASAVGGR